MPALSLDQPPLEPPSSPARVGARRIRGSKIPCQLNDHNKSGARYVTSIENLYAIGRELGRGGSSRVYEGHCRATGKRVALKQLAHHRVELSRRGGSPAAIRPTEASGEAGILKDSSNCQSPRPSPTRRVSPTRRGHPLDCVRLLDSSNEAGILRMIPKHEHILHHPAVYTTPRFTFVISDLLGEDLYSHIQTHGPFPEPTTRRLFVQLLSAVHHLHKASIVHGDIKPENVCFTHPDSRGALTLIDFGSAAVSTGDSLTGMRGTFGYAAPEVAEWARDRPGCSAPSTYGAGADFWSLGVTLHLMLSGTSPFQVRELGVPVEYTPVDLSGDGWTEVSGDAKLLLRGLLQEDASKRWGFAQCMHSEWLDGKTA